MILIPLGNIKEDNVPKSDVLEFYNDSLTTLVAARPTPPLPKPINTTPWIAMSFMQKAIRRGNGPAALMGAATLLRDAPERLWRRIGCIAFEDIGVADIECLGLVTATLAGKVDRRKLGGEWAVASLIVERMADTAKNRSADDLLMTISGLPSLVEERETFATLSDQRLQQIALGCSDLHKRGLALWYLMGTKRCPSPNLPHRQGNVELAFEVLAEHGVSPSMVQIARQGFRKTGEMLAPFAALLTLVNGIRGDAARNDRIPHKRLVGGVPSYALDTYTREGKQSFAGFLKTNAGTVEWMKANLPENGRNAFVGELVFRVEGGCLNNRWAGPAADGLRKIYELGCLGLSQDQAADVLSLMRNDMALLNDCRANVMGEPK
jgi:hypothetical protein